MLRPIVLSVLVLSALGGCARLSESRVNPFNWFGNDRGALAQTASPSAEQRPLVPANRQVTVIDQRSLIETISVLSIERTPSGALVRATGLAPTPGYYNGELVRTGIENGVLSLAFRAQRPAEPQLGPNDRARQITAALALSQAELSGIRSIRVEAAQNARSARP